MICRDIRVAGGFVQRMKGLMFRESLADGCGLYIPRCNSIHSFFMRFKIDAVFVDRAFVIVKIIENLMPWRITGFNWGARGVIELPAGTCSRYGLRKGDTLHMEHGY